MNDHLLKSIQNAVIQLLFENIHFHSQIIIRIALEKVSEHLFKYRPQYWWPYLCVPSRRYCFMPSINLEYISLNRLINLLNSLCISYHRNYPNLLFLFCPYHFLLCFHKTLKTPINYCKGTYKFHFNFWSVCHRISHRHLDNCNK